MVSSGTALSTPNIALRLSATLFGLLLQAVHSSDQACLRFVDAGCSSVTTKDDCLSSRDGRARPSWEGLKVHGEPCAWCGGSTCYSGGTSLCEPLDYLVRGEGIAFVTFTAKGQYDTAMCSDGQPVLGETTTQPPTTATGLATMGPAPTLAAIPTLAPWTTAEPPNTTFAILPTTGTWAPAVTKWPTGVVNQTVTAAEAEGVSLPPPTVTSPPVVIVVPTVSPPTPSSSTSTLVTSPPVAATSTLVTSPPVAASTVAPTAPATLPPSTPFWMPRRPDIEEIRCLHPYADGCNKITNVGICESSSDGRSDVTISGLKVAGEPCVWCGGVPCQSDSASLCEPFDFLMHGEGTAFASFNAKGNFKVASCGDGKEAEHYHLSCLSSYSAGCSGIIDKDTCLSSIDGRNITDVSGLKIHGQPCIWCNGSPCQSNNGNLCEPYDYAVNGAGKAFTTFFAQGNFLTAACENGVPHPATIAGLAPTPAPEGAAQPHWRQTPQELMCLTWVEGGCSTLTDEKSCLANRDGQEQDSMFGVRIRGEPCSWCNGVPCRSGSSSLCEPFDYLVNGAGKVFDTFLAKGSFTTANCSNISLPQQDFRCLTWRGDGCNIRGSNQSCTSSRDGRGDPSNVDYKYYGQPCVWCGGDLCPTSSLPGHGDPTRCEPFDYVVNGGSQAWLTVREHPEFHVAACRDGQLYSPTLAVFTDQPDTNGNIQGFPTVTLADTTTPLEVIPTTTELPRTTLASDPFQGTWNKGTIDGREVIWPSGNTSDLTFPGDGKVSMSTDGVEYEGELQSNGTLHWSDGDVWFRVPRTMDDSQETTGGTFSSGMLFAIAAAIAACLCVTGMLFKHRKSRQKVKKRSSKRDAEAGLPEAEVTQPLMSTKASFDLVTITPQGLFVHPIEGGVPPPGIRVMTDPGNLPSSAAAAAAAGGTVVVSRQSA